MDASVPSTALLDGGPVFRAHARGELMMKYLVRIAGTNFLLRPSGGDFAHDQLFAFFATRVVAAATASDAAREAMRLVEDELRKMKIALSEGAPPKLEVQWVQELGRGNPQTSGAGFTWYPQGGE